MCFLQAQICVVKSQNECALHILTDVSNIENPDNVLFIVLKLKTVALFVTLKEYFAIKQWSYGDYALNYCMATSH